MVRARGSFLQAASETNKGTMAAVLGLERQKLEDICKEAAGSGVCEPVNFNCPGQIVISGTLEAVNKAVELINAAGAKAILLNVSGPFHSSLMEPACAPMAQELDKYNLSNSAFPAFTNCDAERTNNAETIKDKLIRQINHAVKWDESICNIIKEGFDTFIEIGPGRVLCGLLRKIDRSAKALNIEDCASLEKTLEIIK
jgi:[acyl-carrier-protein] S-malonyltransferase